MSGRGRRIAVGLVILALVLSAGRWGSAFLADRLWEASVSQRVAEAGARRALWMLALELLGLIVSIAWLFAHFTIARRIALPDTRPPERDAGRVWPRELPLWSLPLVALVTAVLLGGGLGSLVDQIRLARDGVRFGVGDPLLGADLGVFVRDFPLWLELQQKATILAAAALAGALLLHLAGGTIRVAARRLRVSPRARGQLAVLLAVLAVSLAWGAMLEPSRLAAGLRGPLLASEFLLRSRIAHFEAGLGAAAALFSLLWWLRVRGSVAVGCWLVFALGWIGETILPRQVDRATADPAWQSAARGLDSVAFQLAGVDTTLPARRTPAALLAPTLWDDTVLTRAADSGRVLEARRGWISAAGALKPVWFGVREAPGQALALLALSDDEVSPLGGLLSWREGDAVPAPGPSVYRELSPYAIRPGVPRIDLSASARGVALGGWPQRLVLAWALQVAGALSAPAGTRISWRLDPLVRIRTVAPFAHWSAPRPRTLSSGRGRVVWLSNGLLTSERFPSSAQVAWGNRTISMARSAFLGMVDAESGEVRIFCRDPADSLTAAWARITAPLIEPSSSIPPGLRTGEPYPEELALAQAHVLEGPAWNAGRLEVSGGAGFLPPESTGGSERVIPFLQGGSRTVGTVLLIRRTAAGDSLRLIRLDSLRAIESGSALQESWKRFPFQSALRDSVIAAGGNFVPGAVRFALAEEGMVAYQPAWSVTPSGRTQLALVNVALARGLGTGRTFAEAWKNQQRLIGPTPVGAGSQALLEETRRWFQHADSALKHGNLPEFDRAFSYLRRLLGPPRP